MSDTQIQDGKTLAVSGKTATIQAGMLVLSGGYVGPALTTIIGSSVAHIDAAAIGESLSSGSGTGKGEIALEGVYAFAGKTGLTFGAGEPVFWDGSAVYIDKTNTGYCVGHVYPQDDGTYERAVAATDAAVLTQTGADCVVYVKLLGRPKELA